MVSLENFSTEKNNIFVAWMSSNLQRLAQARKLNIPISLQALAERFNMCKN